VSVLAISVHVYGSKIVVGDLMRSVSLFEVSNNLELREIARDYGALWMTSVLALDDHTTLGAEAEGNIAIFSRNNESDSKGDLSRLIMTSQFGLGEMVNQIRPGKLQCIQILIFRISQSKRK
jgi:DNA damage-binding protein 1